MGHSVGCAAPEVKARIGANRGDDMAACKPWTDAEERYLIEHHGKLSNPEIAQKLGRSVPAVESRTQVLRRLGAIPHAPREPDWTEAEDRRLVAGYAHLTTAMLADDLGRTKDAVDSRIRRLRRAGWDIRAMPRGRGRQRQAEAARAERQDPELSIDADRQVLRDEIAKYLAGEVNANRLDADQVRVLIGKLKSNVLAAPHHRLKRYLDMPVAKIVREAA